MPGNHSEISGYLLAEICTSNRESSETYKKNNLTENFSRNLYVKTIELVTLLAKTYGQ